MTVAVDVSTVSALSVIRVSPPQVSMPSGVTQRRSVYSSTTLLCKWRRFVGMQPWQQHPLHPGILWQSYLERQVVGMLLEETASLVPDLCDVVLEEPERSPRVSCRQGGHDLLDQAKKVGVMKRAELGEAQCQKRYDWPERQS